jgi:hypothetical protein
VFTVRQEIKFYIKFVGTSDSTVTNCGSDRQLLAVSFACLAVQTQLTVQHSLEIRLSSEAA